MIAVLVVDLSTRDKGALDVLIGGEVGHHEEAVHARQAKHRPDGHQHERQLNGGGGRFVNATDESAIL